MSSEIIINVENLSKCYHIYDHPNDRLKQFIFPRLHGLTGESSKQYYSEFWALKDVSFEVKKGETVGIIGKNGSGKSTLLQLICGTLCATSGSISTYGRIAALLELGSGFNPEFTGIENVYLNASILGLKRQEIDNSLDRILSFAELGDHLYQPIKTYSSGMVMRLAFSVSVNVRPDILIVDEALAVGDGAFQLKCMTRLKALQETGVTILFVSHDLNSVGRLCTSAHILDDGRKLGNESVFDSIRTYERMLKIKDASRHEGKSKTRHPLKKIYLESEYFPDFLGSQEAVISDVELFDRDNNEADVFESGDEITIALKIMSEKEFASVIVGFGLRSVQGVRVLGGNSNFLGKLLSLKVGQNIFKIRFRLNLTAGEYFLNIGLVHDGGSRVDLDQRWGVRKLNVLSNKLQVGIAFTSIEFQGD